MQNELLKGIHTPEPPPQVIDAFLKGLSSFLLGANTKAVEHYIGEPTTIPTQEDLGGPLDRALVSVAIHVYSIGLDAAARGDFSAVTPAGWQIFAGISRQGVVMGRVTKRGQNEWKTSSVYYGNWVWDTLDSARNLDQLQQLQAGNYELRILSVPALSMEAFWLMAKTPGAQDLVVPFRAPGKPDADKRPLTVETLANYLASIRLQSMAATHAR